MRRGLFAFIFTFYSFLSFGYGVRHSSPDVPKYSVLKVTNSMLEILNEGSPIEAAYRELFRFNIDSFSENWDGNLYKKEGNTWTPLEVNSYFTQKDISDGKIILSLLNSGKTHGQSISFVYTASYTGSGTVPIDPNTGTFTFNVVDEGAPTFNLAHTGANILLDDHSFNSGASNDDFYLIKSFSPNFSGTIKKFKNQNWIDLTNGEINESQEEEQPIGWTHSEIINNKVGFFSNESGKFAVEVEVYEWSNGFLWWGKGYSKKNITKWLYFDVDGITEPLFTMSAIGAREDIQVGSTTGTAIFSDINNLLSYNAAAGKHLVKELEISGLPKSVGNSLSKSGGAGDYNITITDSGDKWKLSGTKFMPIAEMNAAFKALLYSKGCGTSNLLTNSFTVKVNNPAGNDLMSEDGSINYQYQPILSTLNPSSRQALVQSPFEYHIRSTNACDNESELSVSYTVKISKNESNPETGGIAWLFYDATEQKIYGFPFPQHKNEIAYVFITANYQDGHNIPSDTFVMQISAVEGGVDVALDGGDFELNSCEYDALPQVEIQGKNTNSFENGIYYTIDLALGYEFYNSDKTGLSVEFQKSDDSWQSINLSNFSFEGTGTIKFRHQHGEGRKAVRINGLKVKYAGSEDIVAKEYLFSNFTKKAASEDEVIPIGSCQSISYYQPYCFINYFPNPGCSGTSVDVTILSKSNHDFQLRVYQGSPSANDSYYDFSYDGNADKYSLNIPKEDLHAGNYVLEPYYVHGGEPLCSMGTYNLEIKESPTIIALEDEFQFNTNVPAEEELFSSKYLVTWSENAEGYTRFADGEGVYKVGEKYYFDPARVNLDKGADDIEIVLTEYNTNGCSNSDTLIFKVFSDLYANDMICFSDQNRDVAIRKLDPEEGTDIDNIEFNYSYLVEEIMESYYRDNDRVPQEYLEAAYLQAYNKIKSEISTSMGFGFYQSMLKGGFSFNAIPDSISYNFGDAFMNLSGYLNSSLSGYVVSHNFGSVYPVFLFEKEYLPSSSDQYYRVNLNFAPEEKAFSFDYTFNNQSVSLSLGDLKDHVDFTFIQDNYCNTDTAYWVFHSYLDILDVELFEVIAEKDIPILNIAEREIAPAQTTTSYRINFPGIEVAENARKVLKAKIHYQQGNCKETFQKVFTLQKGVVRPTIMFDDFLYSANDNEEVKELKFCKNTSEVALKVKDATENIYWELDYPGDPTVKKTIVPSDYISIAPRDGTQELMVRYAVGCKANDNDGDLELHLNISPASQGTLNFTKKDFTFEPEDYLEHTVDLSYWLDGVSGTATAGLEILSPEGISERVYFSEDIFSAYPVSQSGVYQMKLLNQTETVTDDNDENEPLFCDWESASQAIRIFRKPLIEGVPVKYMCPTEQSINLSSLFTAKLGDSEFELKEHGSLTFRLYKYILNEDGDEELGPLIEVAESFTPEDNSKYLVEAVYVQPDGAGDNFPEVVSKRESSTTLIKEEISISLDYYNEDLQQNKLCFGAPDWELNPLVYMGNELIEQDVTGTKQTLQFFNYQILNSADGDESDNLLVFGSDTSSVHVKTNKVGEFTLKMELLTQRINNLADGCVVPFEVDLETFNNPRSIIRNFPDNECQTEGGQLDLKPEAFTYEGNNISVTDNNSTFQAIDQDGKERLIFQRSGKDTEVMLDSVGHFNIIFNFIDDNGCSATTNELLKVKARPTADFRVDKPIICINDEEAFSFHNESKLLDLDALFTGHINRLAWDFDNGFSADSGMPDEDGNGNLGGTISEEGNETNTSGIYTDPSHFYTRANKFNVSLIAYSSFGCSNRIEIPIELGANPKVAFDVENFTIGRATNFINSTDIEGYTGKRFIDKLTWDFGDGELQTDYGDEITTDYSHHYAMEGAKTVTLYAEIDSIGCSDELSRVIPVFPLKNPTSENNYSTSFSKVDGANDPAGWLHSGQWDTEYALSSWSLTDGSWQTNTGNHGNEDAQKEHTYYAAENSWIESPTFDLTDLDLPMLSMKLNINSAPGVDGISLRYTCNEGKTWNTVGNMGEGLDWFTNETVLSLPQDNVERKIQGWSGDTGELYARIPLDAVQSDALTPSIEAENPGDGRVRFRLWFASNNRVDATADYTGIKLEEFTVSARNRLVVVENFTHDDVPETQTDAILETVGVNPEELVLLQYGFQIVGSVDELYKYCWMPSGARALHYSVPYPERAMVNGVHYEDKLWSESDLPLVVSQEKLEVARVNIQPINPQDLVDNLNPKTGQTSINVGFETTGLPLEEEDTRLILRPHMVAENFELPNSGRVFKNLAREILPNTAGIFVHIDEADEKGILQFDASFDWTPDHAWAYADKVKMVVTVQGFESDKIYQVRVFDIDKALIAEPPLDAEEMAKKLQLYPNPNEGHFTLEWSSEGLADAWSLYTVDGRKVADGHFQSPTNRQQHIVVEDLADGVYILMLLKEDKILTNKRMMVAH